MVDTTRDNTHVSPFPGLRAFHSDEDYLFFGRDAQTAELATRLRRNRFLAVVGTSGSGKSSLVRAGLIPQLLAGGMRRAGSSWEVAVMRPGGRPIARLADALCGADLYDREMEGVLANLQVTLARSRLGLVEAVRQSDIEEGTNLLVVVDQFEEIFRFRRAGAGAEEQAHDFVNLLLEASDREDAPIYIVITMRSDFIGDCSQFAGLAEAVNRGEYLIPRLTREQCRAAIEGPIRVAAGEVTPQLVQRVLNELGADQDRLPVLQHALMRTWDAWQADHADGEAIDLRHYEATGGMREALSRHADEVFGELPDDRHRRVAERLFKALTERGADNREVRRPARLGMLAEITAASDAELRAVIEAYRRTGRTFVMPVERALESETVIDISHESLMRVWRRLQGWVEEEAQSARVYRRLADTAHLHEQGKAGLFRDPDLQIALAWRRESEPNPAWAARYHEGFEEAMGFLDASEAAERAELEAREAARQRELEQARVLAATQARAARNFKRFAVGVSVLALVAIVLSIWAFVLKERAEESEARADASARAAETARSEAVASREEAVVAREDAVAARDRALHEQGRVWLERAGFFLEEKRFLGAKLLAARALGFDGFGREGRDEAFAAEYPVLLRRESDEWKTAQALIRDLPEYPTIWMSPTRAQGERFLALEFSPDGRTIATITSSRRGASGSSICLWDVSSGAVRLELPASSPARALDFSPDGSLLAFVDEARGATSAQIWNLATQEEVRRVPLPAWSNGLRFSPDGATLATASNDGTVLLWEVASGREVETLRGSWRYVLRLAYSPDGETLAISSEDGTIRLWKVHAPADPPRILQGHTQPVLDLEFSRNGRLLASAGADRAVRIWDLESDTPRVLPHGSRVYGVSFQPGGTLIASVAMDDVLVHLWDSETGAPLPTIGGVDGTGRDSYATRFSPDGRLLAVGHWGGTLDIIDVATRTPRYENAGHKGALSAVTWTSDGTTLASCGDDTTVRVWSPVSGEELARFEASAPFSDVAFTPDGGTLAAAGFDGAIHLFDPARREEIAALGGRSASIDTVDFDSSGTRLASGGGDGNVRLWDISDAGQMREIARFEHGSPVNDVDFGTNGLLAAGGDDRLVRLWDVASGQVRVLEGHGGGINAVAFSPDGAILASASDDRTVRLWEVSSGREIARLEGHTDAIGDVAFSPDGTTLASAGGDRDRTIRLFSVSTRRLLATLEGHSDGVASVAFGPDGLTLASAGRDGSVRLWDIARPEAARFESTGEPVVAIGYHPDGRLLATGGSSDSILLRDITDGRRIRSFDGHTAPIEEVVFSPDGVHLASASRDRTVRLWHVASGDDVWTSPAFGDWVRSVSFSPDGSLLVAASDDGSIRLLDVVTGRVVRVLAGHSSFVTGAVFTPDGSRIVSASRDGTIRLWDVASGRELSRLRRHEASPDGTGGYGGLGLSPDGRLLASCDRSAIVRLWDLARAEEIGMLENPGSVVEDVRFGPDGKLLATLGGTELRLWDVDSRRLAGVFELRGQAESRSSASGQVRFSPDGGRIASADPDGVVHIFDVHWSPRDPSRLADWVDWFAIEGRGGLRPTLRRSLYEPARIDLESPSPDSHLAILRGWKERGEGEAMWRELFHHYVGAGNLEGAAVLIERLAPETAQSERALLAGALCSEAERTADRPESFTRVTGLLDRAEALAPGSPRILAARALAFDARGDVDEADRALERAISLALELGEAGRTELLRLVDQTMTRLLRRGQIARARDALDIELGLPDVAPVSRALLRERYWQAVRNDALARFQAGDSSAARAALLLEVSRWAMARTPIHDAVLPLADALEALDQGEVERQFVALAASWKYLDDGSDPGTAWRAPEFDDAAWSSGPAPLGFGDRRERTRLRRNLEAVDSSGESSVAFYFRNRFEVDTLDEITTPILLKLARDDGAVVYLNGEEILRDNMPAGPVGARTVATLTASGSEESRVREFRLRTDRLREGSNVVAVEVHQATLDSSDLHFALSLAARRPTLAMLGLDKPAIVAQALPDALAILPPALRTAWAPAMEFGFSNSASVSSTVPKDAELWRIRARLQAWLGNDDAVLDSLKGEVESREASDEATDAPRRSDLRAELARRLEAGGRGDDAATLLREWFKQEIGAQGALRLNCGGYAFVGSGGTLWNSDAFCRVGSSVPFHGAVLGVTDPPLYATAREFPAQGPGYRLPLADGLYRVRLHLAETASETPGTHVFDVLLQGETVLHGYESLCAAGFEVEDVRDLGVRVGGGPLDIAFRARAGSNSPTIAGIAITPIDEKTHRRLLRDADDALWVRDSLEEHGAVRINCGSVEEYRAHDGRAWSRDRCFLGGRPAARSSRLSNSFATGFEKTDDDPLYLTERFFLSLTPFAYRVPLPAGRYRVTLHFAEVWSGFARTGSRVFDVRLEGKPVLESYDVFGSVGYATADIRRFDVDVLDGHLDIEFVQRTENPKISAIEIEPLGG